MLLAVAATDGDAEDEDAETFITTPLRHCEIDVGESVIAALVTKVNELNARHETRVEAAGTTVLHANARSTARWAASC